jgi:A/G-specific adenine glycosylase
MNLSAQKIKRFQEAVLTWFNQHGRHDLPWQKNPSPYRVWVSEIMLQQTQVSTVIDYYARFMKKFPNLKLLAQAKLDDVLQLWTGLGYYARARNLHRCAQILMDTYQGRFPLDIERVCELPGIGRSTAGAILSLSKNIDAAILDGNVKRVLARCFTVEGIPDQRATLNTLWEISTKLTPISHAKPYNQAMMDLGATVCTRSKPNCPSCPLKSLCRAYKTNTVANFPTRKSKSKLPIKKKHFLIIQNAAGEILLQKRPNSGIWGGLWSFPEAELGEVNRPHKAMPVFQHAFSHYILEIHPLIIRPIKNNELRPNELWHAPDKPLPGGIPKPCLMLLDLICANQAAEAAP